MKTFLTAALCVFTAFAEQKLGKPLNNSEALSLASLMASPDQYVSKTVQVKGKVTEVCQAMGCWMNLTDDDGHLLRIKVEDGDLVFPKDSVGKMAIAEGKLEKQEMSRDEVIAQSKHEAEEAGRPFNAAKVKSGKTIYQIAGSGAVILDK